MKAKIEDCMHMKITYKEDKTRWNVQKQNTTRTESKKNSNERSQSAPWMKFKYFVINYVLII